MTFLDVPEQVARLDKVVARIEIAGVLECEREAARLGVDAEPRRLAHPVREGDIEHLDIDRGDVVPDPLLEDVHQEASVLHSPDRTARDDVSFLDVQGPVTPRLPRDRAVLRSFGDSLDDRDELD